MKTSNLKIQTSGKLQAPGFRYFVAYHFSNSKGPGFGNIIMMLNVPISGPEQTEAMRDWISENTFRIPTTIVILNWLPLPLEEVIGVPA